MKSGFVSILGLPNAGKSTLLNALMGEKLAIISHKSQTTRHRIKGILSEKDYQLVISDTPGIIDPEYKLHEKMMQSVKSAAEDADVALLLTDASGNLQKADAVFSTLRLKVPALVVLNKTDKLSEKKLEEALAFFAQKPYCRAIIHISALNRKGIDELVQQVLQFIPEGDPFYTGDDLSDLPTKFFVQEIIREKIFQLFQDEVPYQSTVLVTEFKEKQTLVKISADIIVQRESQKGIIIGDGGKMIKKIGSLARQDIEGFLQQKVFLELFVKTRNHWRENDLYLKEYGY
ncbi:MAG: GTPase Era [Dinghuibacter sp.]|nr:GTPase Era [Dinghuibacter sp.]